MRSHTVFLLAILCLGASPAFGQSNHKGGNQQVLPATFVGWNCTSRISLDLGRPHATVAGNPTAIAAEYGFVSGEQCTYTRGNNSLEAQIYVMNDATAAYGEYSYLRTSDLPKADLGEHSSIAEHRALALDGNLVLDVFDAQDDLTKLESDLKALLRAISVHAEEGPLPTLWQHMPADKQVLRSDHYILGPIALAQFFPLEQGDWLGFSNGAEAEAAHYNLDGQDVNLLIADFPTPQMAGAKLTELQKRFAANSGALPNGSRLFAKRSVTLVALANGARSQAEADTLLSQIQTGTQITWNEPAFQFREPSIEMMIVGSIIGTGTICLFAMVAGLAFGGFRLFIKRVLPDRVFDRSSHLQVLQMGLNSKPINSDDFYGNTGELVSSDTVVDRHLSDRVALRLFR